MMRIGVAPGAYTNDLLAALDQRINIEAEIVAPERDPDEYRYVLAVDDDPVPPSNEVRRYITHQTPEASQWTVVAARHLLLSAVERGVALPIAVPMPVEPPRVNRGSHPGVTVLPGQDQQRVITILQSDGVSVLPLDSQEVGIVVDASRATSRVEPMRRAMAGEKVLIALSTNAAATDTIQHDTDGFLANDLDEISHLARRLVENESDRPRLGFEARRSVGSASWNRVIRALLLDGRAGIPHLQTFSHLPARTRWLQRLGHAHQWRTARYTEGAYIEGGNQRIKIGQLGELRHRSLLNATGGRD
ncbi:MAG: hypothetical protein VYC75_06500 [Actinomycetota bacterium]|nr:hypothetical protein [Actinomycetota bacterium]